MNNPTASGGSFHRANLFPSLSPIALFAQHLTIFGNCFSAFMPRFYMISFHFFNFKMFLAFFTDAFLSFIRFSFLFIGKSANIQEFFIAS